MRRLFTIFATFVLLLFLAVSCEGGEDGIVDPDPETEVESDDETGGGDDEPEDDETTVTSDLPGLGTGDIF